MHKHNRPPKSVTERGFTIVELLIVIIVVGILATLVLLSYGNVQDQARIVKAKNDVSEISKALSLARSNKGMTFYQLVGNNYTAGPCVNEPAGTNLATLPKTDPCWVDYYTALDAISTASGISINKVTDPWGRPYFIDENEGVGGECRHDTISMYVQPFVSSYVPDVRMPNENMPYSSFTGCT